MKTVRFEVWGTGGWVAAVGKIMRVARPDGTFEETGITVIGETQESTAREIVDLANDGLRSRGEYKDEGEQ